MRNNLLRHLVIALFIACPISWACAEPGGTLFSASPVQPEVRQQSCKPVSELCGLQNCEPNETRRIGNWTFLPNGLIYPAYLADPHESRVGGVWNNDKNLGWIWDATLGGHLPIVRYGTRLEGFQVDFEASAHLRLDMENSFDMYSTDYRAGVPISWGNQTWQFKTALYHVSSHAGDEFILRQVKAKKFVIPGSSYRYPYSRDSLVAGVAYRPRPDVRIYGELDYDFTNGSDEGMPMSLHVLFGAEYSAPFQPQKWFTPFAAANVILYEEKSYDGNICLQAGVQWRGTHNQLFRFGIQYFQGVSEMYQNIEYFPKESKVGIGFWYDF